VLFPCFLLVLWEHEGLSGGEDWTGACGAWTTPHQEQKLQMPKSENKSKDEEMDEKKPQVPDNKPMAKGGLAQEHVPEATSEADRILGMTKDYSGWDVYNNEARKVDNELVKDWTTRELSTHFCQFHPNCSYTLVLTCHRRLSSRPF
jgi:hypothetical protein